MQSARYLQGVRHYHDRNVQRCSFNVGDMVLQWIQDDTRLHKLNSQWEGPFIVYKVTGSGSYRLQYPNGQEVPNSWNIEHLCRFHPWNDWGHLLLVPTGWYYQYNSILSVYDSYYTQVYLRGFAPIIPVPNYYSTTSLFWSLKGLCANTFSTTPSY
jgi:hypothetical protein